MVAYLQRLRQVPTDRHATSEMTGGLWAPRCVEYRHVRISGARVERARGACQVA